MYKWPQGRVIRTVCLVLILVIAVDLGYTGSWSNIDAYFFNRGVATSWTQLVLGGIYTALTLVVFIGGTIAVGFKPVAVDFLIEVEQEMTRVIWPSPRELVRSTLVIAAMIVVLATFIFVVDWVNLGLFQEFIFRRKG